MVTEPAIPTGGRGSRFPGVVSGFVLKLARQSAGFTQERFAESAGVDASTVQAWESGRRPLSAMQAGDFLLLRNSLTRAGAPPSIGRHLHEAVEADLVLSSGITAGGHWSEREPHPLAAVVHRRSLTNMITWPVTGQAPAALLAFTSKVPRRGPVANGPSLSAEERTRFFDHLLAVAEQANGPENLLLRRQAVYLLGFDHRTATADWLRAEWQRAFRKKVTDGDVSGLLGTRSASVALASAGDGDRLHDFVAGISGEQAEIANLNYWAYWIGELVDDQVDDAFMMRTDSRSWGGVQLMRHLIERLDVTAPQLRLNLHTLHSLVALRPSLLTEWPQLHHPLMSGLEKIASADSISRSARDQIAGLRYAVRIAGR